MRSNVFSLYYSHLGWFSRRFREKSFYFPLTSNNLLKNNIDNIGWRWLSPNLLFTLTTKTKKKSIRNSFAFFLMPRKSVHVCYSHTFKSTLKLDSVTWCEILSYSCHKNLYINTFHSLQHNHKIVIMIVLKPLNIYYNLVYSVLFDLRPLKQHRLSKQLCIDSFGYC